MKEIDSFLKLLENYTIPGEWKKRAAFERLLLPEQIRNDILQYLIE